MTSNSTAMTTSEAAMTIPTAVIIRPHSRKAVADSLADSLMLSNHFMQSVYHIQPLPATRHLSRRLYRPTLKAKAEFGLVLYLDSLSILFCVPLWEIVYNSFCKLIF